MTQFMINTRTVRQAQNNFPLPISEFWTFIGLTGKRRWDWFKDTLYLSDETSMRRVELLLSPHHKTLLKALLVSTEPRNKEEAELFRKLNYSLGAITEIPHDLQDDP